MMRNLLAQLEDKKKAMIAFNVQNLFQLEGLSQISKEKRIPVIAQFSAKYISYFEKTYGFDFLISKYQSKFFFFHLDHCLNEKIIRYCIDKGFSSVMFDGSSLPINENIEKTNLIYDYAQQKGTLVEAEIGSINGVEDGFGNEEGSGYYSIDELVRFNGKAHFDMLALAIGNAHGLYETIDSIDVKKIGVARDLIGSKYFVLHGGTGMPEEMIREAIEYGVIKINVSTALKMKQFSILEEFLKKNKIYDEINFFDFFMENIKPFFESFVLKYTI